MQKRLTADGWKGKLSCEDQDTSGSLPEVGVLTEFNPIEFEDTEAAEYRVSRRVKDKLGCLEGKDETFGYVPMPTQTVGEVAAAQHVYCTYPDDGSGHVCPKKPCMPHELLSLNSFAKPLLNLRCLHFRCRHF